MHKSQANLARVSARADHSPRVNTASTLFKREPIQHGAARPVRNRAATRLTATQRNSEGRRSEWSASQNYRNSTTTDARWSA